MVPRAYQKKLAGYAPGIYAIKHRDIYGKIWKNRPHDDASANFDIY